MHAALYMPLLSAAAVRLPLHVTRRHALAAAAAVAAPTAASADLTAPVGTATPDFYRTASGIVYYDAALGADCALNRCQRQPEGDGPLRAPAAPLLADGADARINYRVRSSRVGARGQDGEIFEASDSIGLGSVRFFVGDGSINAAVDELVRTLPPQTTRRATVPASFDLDRAGSREPSYLELWLRKPTSAAPIFACFDVDGSCLCVPSAAGGGTDLLPKTD